MYIIEIYIDTQIEMNRERERIDRYKRTDLLPSRSMTIQLLEKTAASTTAEKTVTNRWKIKSLTTETNKKYVRVRDSFS